MTLSIIVATSQNGVIGQNNQIPWHLPDDLKRFKAITMGHPLIMGRKNYESIGRVLPGRTNIVITRNENFKADGIVVVHSFEDALEKAEESPGADEIFVIGGADIYRLAIEEANKVYLTFIEKDFKGDVLFPEIDLQKDFRLIEKSARINSPENDFSYSYLTYVRN